jgi:hypothetical protein
MDQKQDLVNTTMEPLGLIKSTESDDLLLKEDSAPS